MRFNIRVDTIKVMLRHCLCILPNFRWDKCGTQALLWASGSSATKAPGSPHISRSPSGQGPLSEFMGIFKEKLQCKHRSSNWYQSQLGNFYIEEMQKVCVDITCFTQLMSLFLHTWTATSEFGTYRLCEQRRFRRACASAQSRQNLRCSLI